MAFLIQWKNVSVHYGNLLALKQVNLTVNEGDYLSVVGENGSGKSTLIKVLLGLVNPSEGHVTLRGISSNDIGYLPQQSGIQRRFPATVSEVVLSGSLSRGIHFIYPKSVKEDAEHWLKTLDLWNLRHKGYRKLSGGQQQRVLLARALMAGSKLLVLDEPVNGLDPKITNEFYALLRRLHHQGLTIVMVSHDLTSALEESSRIVQLNHHIIYDGLASDFSKEDYYAKEVSHDIFLTSPRP